MQLTPEQEKRIRALFEESKVAIERMTKSGNINRFEAAILTSWGEIWETMSDANVLTIPIKPQLADVE
jgi:hypothetical protein